MKAFSSPILLESISRMPNDPALCGQMLKHFQNALYAISYHLEQALPKNGVVCALFPKSILAHVLPAVAQKRNCTVISVQGTREVTLALAKAHVLDTETDIHAADFYLTEPDGLTHGGAYATPAEAHLLKEYNPTAIGSIFQWTTTNPATHDFIPLSTVITELGRHKTEHFPEAISAFSWPTLIPSTTYQSQTAVP